MTGHIADLIGPYVLGELDVASVAMVEDHLTECFICRTEVNEARAVLDVLPFAIDPIAPPPHLRRAIMATIAAQRPLAARPRDRMPWVLAAGLALALLGDVALGIRLADTSHAREAHVVADRTPTATATPVASRPSVSSTLSATLRPTLAPSIVPARPPSPTAVPASTAPPIVATPVPHVSPAPPSRRDLALARSREREIDRLRAFVTRDAGRIAQLTDRLARDARASAGSARNDGIVAALAAGRVYSVDGVVGTEAWHGTVVQPSPTANAILLTRAPSAPQGDGYHVWVLRGGRAYDAGAVAPHVDTTLEMPMPLVAGDVVAFSREPVPSTSVPTQPFLMKIAITE